MTFECNVCQGSFTEEEGGRCGYIGILSVAFCPTCYAGIADMVEQTDYREWEEGEEHMTRKEALAAIKLLAALESWAFSTKTLLPDYLHEEMQHMLDVLSKIVLEKQV